jgi:hypothetical protein
VSRPTKEKLTVPLAVLRQINCQPCRKKAVAFDRDQNSRGFYSPPLLSKGHRVNWVEQANVSASRAH